jgi:D-lactate dehydrogenase
VAGRQSFSSPQDEAHQHLVLPNGMPRTCCEETALTDAQKALFKTLKRIAGKNFVLDGRVASPTETSPFLKGARLGQGTALYIVRPQKLKQIIEIVKESVNAGCVVLVQGQNTGLTGGSVPREMEDRRPTVVVSMKDLDTIFPIDNGDRVVCLAGAGLASLQTFVQGAFDRESHSILGSTFLNPTTAAGVALGSGGTQCRKGPAYTERALYLKVASDKFGRSTVKVVNTLGIEGLDFEEGEFDAHLRHDGVIPKLDTYVMKVDGGHDNRMKKSNKTYGKAFASDVEYKNRLCQDDGKISRYNADTSGCDCNRSEGKVLILATVHDTFPRPSRTKTFWVSFDSLKTTLAFRRVCLENPLDLPVSIEYMDRGK